MKMHLKQMKKAISLMLLLALMTVMVKPLNSYAVEDEGEIVQDLIQTDEANLPPQESSDYSNQNDTNNLKKDEIEELPIKDSVVEPEALTKKSVEEQQEAKSTKFEPTTPVIEKIEFAQNKTTVKNDEVLTLSLYAYDDSAISDIRIKLRSEDYSGSESMEWNKDAGTKEHEYVFTYPLDGVVTGKIYISSIEVVDEHTNKTDYNVYDDAGGYKYWVVAEASENSQIHVKNFNFPQNGQSVETVNELLTEDTKIETVEAIEDTTVSLLFEKENGECCILYFYASDEGSSHQLFYGSDSSNNNSGKYTLKEVYVTRGQFSTKIPLEMENKENYSFTLTKDYEWNYEEPQLELVSVNVDKNGKIVHEGESVAITVEVKNIGDASLPEEGYISLDAAAPNIDADNTSVDLRLNKEDQKYHGTLVTENLYPCEWYINYIHVGSEYWYEGDFPDQGRYPYYVQVYKDDSFVNPTLLHTNIRFMSLDEEGYYYPVSTVTKENVERRQTFKEIGVVFPEMKSEYSGINQIGWMDDNGNDITEDTQIVDDEYLTIYAKYNKVVMNASYEYPDNEGKWNNVTIPLIFERGQTYGGLLESVKGFVPEDITKEYSCVGWDYKYSNYKDEDIIPDRKGNVTFVAKFADVTWGSVDREYFDKEGKDGYANEILAVKEGTTVGGVMNMLNKSDPPELYEGLRFKEWEIDTYIEENESAPLKNGQNFYMRAIYDNCLVRYIIYGYDGEEKIFCQVAEIGETITALTEFEGFGEVTWFDNAPDKTFVVNEHITFVGEASNISEDPNQPTQPTKPSQPSKPSGSNSSSTSGSDNKPDVTSDSKLPDSVIKSVVEEVNNAEPGKDIKINMNSSTTISKEILEAAKGKDVTLTLEMEGYSWTINGQDVQAMELKDIDLKVIKNTNNIPSSTVKSLAGDNPCMQITLAHQGNFGFKATLNIGIGAEHAGKYGNLYYHDSVGKMVFINAGQINADGNVSLQFSHASDYLLVMSDQPMSQANVPDSLMPTGTDQNGTNQNGNITLTNVNNNVRKSAKTGDYNMISLWILLCVAALGTMAYASKKRQA